MSSALALAIVHQLPPPDLFDPPALIEDIHRIAVEFGYDRVRIDRGIRPNGFYYEVGYGCGTVRVRLSDGGRWEVSRENYRPDMITNLAYALEAGES